MSTAYFSILDAFLKPADGGVVKTDKDSHFIYPSGKPRIPHSCVVEKFKALTNGQISVSTQEGIVERILNLEEMADINKLLT